MNKEQLMEMLKELTRKGDDHIFTLEMFLPKQDNEKMPINYNETIEQLDETISGYTLFTQGIQGFWIDSDGTKYKDDHIMIRIDFTRNEVEQIKLACDILFTKQFKTQLAVYVRYENQTSFIDQTNVNEFINNLGE